MVWELIEKACLRKTLERTAYSATGEIISVSWERLRPILNDVRRGTSMKVAATVQAMAACRERASYRIPETMIADMLDSFALEAPDTAPKET